MLNNSSPAVRFLTANAWAMEPNIFGHMTKILEDHAAGIRSAYSPFGDDEEDGGDPASNEQEMRVVGSTAIVPIRGIIARYADQVNGICQDQGRSAEKMQSDLAAVAKDDRILSVILAINSPGGMVQGTSETADAIRSLSASGKRVIAYVDGMCASAALWLASQADEIIASAPTAEIGSIGVITAYVDATAAQAEKGYKVRVFRSVDLKAPGTMNESLTPDQAASIGRMLADLHAVFVDAVSAGRGLAGADLAAVTTGEMFTAHKAKALGLIDGVESMDSLLARLATGGSRETSTASRALPAAPGYNTKVLESEKIKMDNALALVDALITEFPDFAKVIASEAKAGKDEAGIRAAIGAALMAAEHNQLAIDLELANAVNAEQVKAMDALAKELGELKASHADVSDKFAKLSKVAAGAADASKVKADKEDPRPQKSAEEMEAMSPIERAKFYANGGKTF